MAESASLKFASVRELRRVTEREKELTREVWRHVEKNYDTYGVLVFRELFTAHPTYKRFFLDVIGADEDPFKSARFQKHMLKVLLPTIGGLIHHLDAPEAVHEAMKRLGVQHRKKELGLRRENVEALGQVVLTTVKREVDGMTEQQDQALTKVMTIITNMFSNGLEGKTG